VIELRSSSARILPRLGHDPLGLGARRSTTLLRFGLGLCDPRIRLLLSGR